MTTLTKNNQPHGFYLSVSCPGCGAELKLDDNYFVVHCSHCDSNHRLKTPDSPPAFLTHSKIDKREGRVTIDRYLKEKGLPLTSSTFQLKKIYYPYWKIDAVLFKVRKKKEKRIVASEYDNAQEISYEKEQTEISLTPYQTTLAAGYQSDEIPYSIGMRSEYLKLEVYSEENMEDDFVPVSPNKSWDEVKKNLDGNLRVIKNVAINEFGANKTELFFPKASIIFFPYLIYDFYNNGFDRYIIDGLTGRLVGHIDQPILNSSIPEEKEDIEFGEIKVEPHQCRNCSEDLPDKQSYLYICRNCQALEVVDDFNMSLKEIKFCDTGDVKPNQYLPFWSFELDEKTAQMLRPYFGGIFNSDRLIVPAFKIENIDAMFRLTKRVSSAYPRLNPTELYDTNDLFKEVNLKPTEALTFADIFVYKDKYIKGQSSPGQVQFQPLSVSLLYLPFEAENYFYVDSVLNAVTFEKSLL